MLRPLFLLCFMLPLLGYSQSNYPSYQDLNSALSKLTTNSAFKESAIGLSYGGEKIRLFKLETSGQPKPTLLIVAGVDGKHPAGVVSAVEMLKYFQTLPGDAIQRVLKDKSIWVIPLANPDAYKRNSSAGHWLSGNARQIDNDRDGRIDEDPTVDLNKDGLISQMRVSTISGNMIADSLYTNILVHAGQEQTKGLAYTLYNEGIDLDFDGRFGEDGEGGVNIDRNFTYNYSPFVSETGDYAASEPETRALLDLLYNSPQISTVLHFGLGNNLSKPEVYDGGKANARIVSSWLKPDVNVSEVVSKRYNRLTDALGKGKVIPAVAGNFSNTVYYHVGKYSFVTPVWWISGIGDESNSTPEKRIDHENKVFAKWATDQHIEKAILPWVKVEHPNFPDQLVEVGGVIESAKNNPPVSFLKDAVELHAKFVTDLLDIMPSLQFEKPVVTSLGEDIYRIELSVANTGLMSTYPAIADKLKLSSKFKTVCKLSNSQKFVSGKRLELYPTLEAGQMRTFTWLIRGKGKVEVLVGCPSAGEQTIEISL